MALVEFYEKGNKQIMVTGDRDWIQVSINALDECCIRSGSSYATVRDMKQDAAPSTRESFMEVNNKVMLHLTNVMPCGLKGVGI